MQKKSFFKDLFQSSLLQKAIPHEKLPDLQGIEKTYLLVPIFINKRLGHNQIHFLVAFLNQFIDFNTILEFMTATEPFAMHQPINCKQ